MQTPQETGMYNLTLQTMLFPLEGVFAIHIPQNHPEPVYIGSVFIYCFWEISLCYIYDYSTANAKWILHSPLEALHYLRYR